MSPTPCSMTPQLPLPSRAAQVVLPGMSSVGSASPPARFILTLVRTYQRFFSTALAMLSGSGCRFTPTCSEYAHQAIELHGALRGSKMALLRVCRCHPFHPGGYDPPHR